MVDGVAGLAEAEGRGGEEGAVVAATPVGGGAVCLTESGTRFERGRVGWVRVRGPRVAAGSSCAARAGAIDDARKLCPSRGVSSRLCCCACRRPRGRPTRVRVWVRVRQKRRARPACTIVVSSGKLDPTQDKKRAPSRWLANLSPRPCDLTLPSPCCKPAHTPSTHTAHQADTCNCLLCLDHALLTTTASPAQTLHLDDHISLRSARQC